MTPEAWIALISAIVAALSLADVVHGHLQSGAREDGKTAEVLREVNEKLKAITDQEAANSARMEDVIERLVAVERSDKEAHRRINELWKELHK